MNRPQPKIASTDLRVFPFAQTADAKPRVTKLELKMTMKIMDEECDSRTSFLNPSKGVRLMSKKTFQSKMFTRNAGHLLAPNFAQAFYTNPWHLCSYGKPIQIFELQIFESEQYGETP